MKSCGKNPRPGSFSWSGWSGVPSLGEWSNSTCGGRWCGARISPWNVCARSTAKPWNAGNASAASSAMRSGPSTVRSSSSGWTCAGWPWRRGEESAAYRKAAEERKRSVAELQTRYEQRQQEAQSIKAVDAEHTVTLADAAGRREELPLSQIVRLYPANELSLPQKLAHLPVALVGVPLGRAARGQHRRRGHAGHFRDLGHDRAARCGRGALRRGRGALSAGVRQARGGWFRQCASV